MAVRVVLGGMYFGGIDTGVCFLMSLSFLPVVTILWILCVSGGY